MARTPLVLSAPFVLALACTGPALHLDNPGQHPVFLDGVATTATTLPFRYYGTTRWDALPQDVAGRADFQRRPQSQRVAIPAPASLWLFPLDFLVELATRAANGRGDTTATIAVEPAATAPPRLTTEMLNAELADVTKRAKAARPTR